MLEVLFNEARRYSEKANVPLSLFVSEAGISLRNCGSWPRAFYRIAECPKWSKRFWRRSSLGLELPRYLILG